MPKWLITGGSGFLGRHLVSKLGNQAELILISRNHADRSHQADLLDPKSLIEVLDLHKPEVIFHLAGQILPADTSSLDLANRQATVNLVEALAKLGRPVRLIATGSAAELGHVPDHNLPVGEDYPPCPVTDYGRSKLAATLAVLSAPKPIQPVVARIFNPIGPAMPASQSLGRFASLLANGNGPLTLETGDLAPKRDFLDVRDVADALLTLAASSATGLFHVGAGQSHSVRQGLEHLIIRSQRQVTLKTDPTRATGPLDSVADITRIRSETGWIPTTPFTQSLDDLWEATLESIVRD
jgi:GDP-4-dehydro-6-deoxy-D-mannose reductase